MRTSGPLKTRASSITSAVPEPSSSAASPKPRPSMWAPTMYISSGCVVPTLVQYTSSRGPGTGGGALSARSVGSDCACGSVLGPAGLVMPRSREPPAPARSSPLAIAATGAGAAFCGTGSRDGVYSYWRRPVVQPLRRSCASIQSTAARLRSVPCVPIAELRQRLDGGLVGFKIEPFGQHPGGGIAATVRRPR